ncbi:hypothetical protein [Nakamurella deserti]|uniref:hypothetical protein n=1 Tax=Nakamurella deserti TaxID=2164074 RepID=UPI00197B3FAE|nr:hypothetical protein [Nakamurella deserti]
MSSPHDPHQGTGPEGGQGPGPQQPWGQPPQGQPWQGQPQQGQPWGQQPPPQWNPQQGGDQPTQQWGPQQGGDQPTQQWGPQQGQAWPGQPFQGQPWQGQPQQGQPQQGQPWGQQPPPQWNPQQGGDQPTQQWGQPPAGDQQQWGQQPWQGGDQGRPYPAAAQPGQPGGQPPKKNKGVLITAIAVVVALLAGVGVYFLAIRKNSGGQDTPVAAAQQLFADVDNGDLIGLTDTFDPVEAQFVDDLATDVIEQFKRLGLLTDSATVDNATGTNISIKGITFDDAAEEKPLPDLTIVKLTGGTVTINPVQDSGVETDLYRRLVDAVQKKAADEDLPMTSTSEPTVIDIAQVIRDENNGEPIRISTVERDGAWYPSLFYTLADYWAQSAGVGPVTTADAIPGAGKGSPEDAVDAMIQALVDQDATAIIGLLPPDEMSAVHAYGKKIADAIGSGSGAQDVQIDTEWNVSDVTGGKLVSVKSLQFTADGESGSIEIDQAAGSVTVTDGSDTQTFDADSLGELIGAGRLEEIHPDMPDFVQRMLKAALGLGVVTTEVDGQWYVSPLRSYSAIFTVLLGGMEQTDIEMFIDLLEQ